MIRFNLIITSILLVSFFNCKAQLIPQLGEDAQLLVGTWITEGSTIANKWVFNADSTLDKYDENQIYDSYSWVILNSTTPSGIVNKHLKIINVTDSSEEYHYEISALNEERLVLVYQKVENMGIGKPLTLFKQ